MKIIITRNDAKVSHLAKKAMSEIRAACDNTMIDSGYELNIAVKNRLKDIPTGNNQKSEFAFEVKHEPENNTIKVYKLTANGERDYILAAITYFE